MSSSVYAVPDYHIEKICSYIKDDKYIASYLGVSRKRVENIRKRLPKPEVHDDSIYTGADTFVPMIIGGSQALLQRQLETGFHWLSQDGLNKINDEYRYYSTGST